MLEMNECTLVGFIILINVVQLLPSTLHGENNILQHTAAKYKKDGLGQWDVYY